MNDLRERAASVICVGFDGQELSSSLERRLLKLPFAGVILFGRNVESVEQTRALTDRIRTIYRNPVIAIDQEGGRVARLRKGAEELPAMMALAATGDRSLAQRAGAQVAFDLRRAGVNLDFAPVLDLALYPMNTVIGARSFGDDPDAVADMAGAFARGLADYGIVATFKHFPGHGSTAVDSHLDLPRIDVGEEMLRARDLVPFARLLPHAQTVMTAHIVAAGFDKERAATISPRLLTDLLRREIGFNGVCFTDCMQMRAIADGIGSARGAVEALVAGADCVLISHSAEVAQESIDAIVRAVESGYLSRARLDEAVARVQALRSQLQAPLPIDAASPHAGIGREVGVRAVTALGQPVQAECARSIALTFEGTTVEGVQGLHSEHAALPAPQALEQLRLALDPADADLDAALEAMRGSGKRPIVLMRRAHVYERQFAAVRRVWSEFPDAIFASVREPYDALALGNARYVFCTYGDDAPSLAGLSDVIFGGVPARGRLPIDQFAYASRA